MAQLSLWAGSSFIDYNDGHKDIFKPMAHLNTFMDRTKFSIMKGTQIQDVSLELEVFHTEK